MSPSLSCSKAISSSMAEVLTASLFLSSSLPPLPPSWPSLSPLPPFPSSLLPLKGEWEGGGASKSVFQHCLFTMCRLADDENDSCL